MWNPKYFPKFYEKYNLKDPRSAMNTMHEEHVGNETNCNETA